MEMQMAFSDVSATIGEIVNAASRKRNVWTSQGQWRMTPKASDEVYRCEDYLTPCSQRAGWKYRFEFFDRWLYCPTWSPKLGLYIGVVIRLGELSAERPPLETISLKEESYVQVLLESVVIVSSQRWCTVQEVRIRKRRRD